ncbi:MAG: hypothetical protein WC806_06450 [Candidatus Gracilibacteria bacterium]|jgi:hypothetical protein
MIEAQKLHLEFIRLGALRHKLKNKMLMILPEIYNSGIYKKYAGSIVEYAGKFGDIAKTTVIKRLRLEKNLENKKCLKAAIEKVGVHKVAMVAKLATAETDKTFAEKVLNMSKEAVQSLSKELREKPKVDCLNKEQMKFCELDCEPQACHAIARTTKIELDEESTFIFIKLKAKLGKHLSDKEALKIMLKDRAEEEFSEKSKVEINKAKSQKNVVTKNIISETFDQKEKMNNSETSATESKKIESQANKIIIKKIVSRYVPAQKRKNSLYQTNNHCAYPNCNLPPEIFHHTDRFASSQSHESIIPLCKIHHEFAHNNLIQNETMSAEKWQLSIQKPPASQISQADILYKKYRQKSSV